jgi:L-seryl-tRNA(Ser) seleniumtransferase
VGTTNRTRAADFAAAVSDSTAAFLRVSCSNFEMVGFTESPDLDELVSAAHHASLPLLHDEGAGCVIDPARYGFRSRPTVRDLLSRGVDAVTCSTDKLIGATQGGLILGGRQIIDRCRKHPLMRALRAGKESYAVIIGTLRSFLAGTEETGIPIYRMLSLAPATLRGRAARYEGSDGIRVIECESVLGGGTTPNESIPSIGVEVDGPAEEIAGRLMEGAVPIIGRIRNDQFSLDLRTIDPDEDEIVLAAIRGLGSTV